MTNYATHSEKTDPQPIPTIPFVLTKNDRDTVALCRVEIEAMKRHRDPIGLEVGTATPVEWLEARSAFRSQL